jgi:hypothetical protein
LLHFFGIGVGDLIRNIRSGDNEEERFNWDQSYVSILMNPSLTPEKVTSLLGDPVFIQAYENKKVMDAITKKNQEIGSTVEEEFRKVFEGLNGYKIERKPIGSDYIIECDFNHYLLLGKAEQKKFIIEIKSSRSTEVRMTVAQGNKAYEEKENYILCVVPLDGNENINDITIIKNARFVTNIASLLKSRVEKIGRLSALQKDTLKIENTDDVNIRTEIDGMNIRYAINQKVWLSENALTFSDFIKRLT